MAISRHYQTTVSTAATRIAGTELPGWILRTAQTSAIMYVGGSDVTSGTGFPIEPGEIMGASELASKSLRGRSDEALYGITAASSADVRVLIQSRVNA